MATPHSRTQAISIARKSNYGGIIARHVPVHVLDFYILTHSNKYMIIESAWGQLLFFKYITRKHTETTQ